MEHVKRSNPDVFLTTVSYPIKGTGYFAKVRDKVALPLAWAEGSDRDYVDSKGGVALPASSRTGGCAARRRRRASKRETPCVPPSCS